MLTLKYKNLLFFLKSEWKKNLTKLLFAQSVHQDTFSPEMQKEICGQLQSQTSKNQISDYFSQLL